MDRVRNILVIRNKFVLFQYESMNDGGLRIHRTESETRSVKIEVYKYDSGEFSVSLVVKDFKSCEYLHRETTIINNELDLDIYVKNELNKWCV